jgi:AmmeMemoRadiSam system protein B
MLTYGLLVPHPPAIIPAIGGAETQKFEKTIGALLDLSLRLREHAPDTLVILTPHAEVRPDSFTIRVPKTGTFLADFSDFGAPAEKHEYHRDRIFTAQLIESVSAAGLKITPVDEQKLDYGTSVPLHYLAASLPEVEIVSLGVSLGGAAEHARLGAKIREVADESGKKVVFIASAELSHKLTKASEHGYCPAGANWDRELMADLKAGEFDKILARDPFETDEVGECGFRSLAAMIGAFAGIPAEHEILSYEAPSGVGLPVGFWHRTGV